MIVRRCAATCLLAALAVAASAAGPPPSAIEPASNSWANFITTHPLAPIDSGRTRLTYVSQGWDMQDHFPPLVRRTGQLIEVFSLINARGCPISPASFCYPGPSLLFTADLGVLPAGVYDLAIYQVGWPIGIPPALPSRHTLTVAADPATNPGPEPPEPLLRDGRFEVAVSWKNAAGEEGTAQLVQPPSEDSALFYFFDPDNWELMVKVLDGCAINGHFWVFAAASTDLELNATVTDLEAGGSFSFGNRLGQPAVATRDIQAFACDAGGLAAGGSTASTAAATAATNATNATNAAAQRFNGIYNVEFTTPTILPVGSTANVMIDVLSKSWPPNELHSVTRSGRTIRIETISPPQSVSVPQYHYMLPIDIRLPGDTEGWYSLELWHRDSLDDSELDTIYMYEPTLTFFEPHPDYQSVILETLPARPTAEDEVIAVLDRQPLNLSVERGDDVVRLSHKAGSPRHPGGWQVPLGKLPAGKHRLQTYVGTSFEDELEIEVLPAPLPPPEPILAGEFEVAVTWRDAHGGHGEAQLVQAPSRDSALFYFFSPDNWELMLKVLDGCAINGHYWVFGAASTDVGYEIEIRRRGSAQVFRTENAVGQAAPAITEIAAFPCDGAAP